MFERIKHMLIKEMIQMFRDPKMKLVLFVAPIFQILVFGYAVTTDVRNITTAIYDLDHSVESRELLSGFLSSRYFEVVEYIDRGDRVRELLDRGEARAVLQLNKGFGEAVRTGRTAKLQILLDGTDSNTAGIVLNYANHITGRYNQLVLNSRMTRIRGQISRGGAVELQTRTWFNENLESRNFYVPAVIALLVMVITLMLSSMAVVREKEIGTMEQIIVTPIGRAEFIIGKTIPFALIGFADVALVTVVAVFWFEVPVRGSLLLLLVATGLYLMNTLGIGLLISTVSRTQQQAMMSAFFFNFPAVLLSGFMFPIANMPEVIQWVTYLNPLRYFLVIVRGIFLKGIGPEILWPQMTALFMLGSCMLWFASRRFRKTLT